jgi:uncharacterized protein with NAD-binding domain and iron-sulfur cluster
MRAPAPHPRGERPQCLGLPSLELLVVAAFVFILASVIPPVSSTSTAGLSTAKPRVVVVGAGWAGWGAAKALCENGCAVTLIDAMKDPTGLTPYVTPTGKPFEPGTKGFWFDYPNIENLVTDYLKLQSKDVFSPFTESCFYSPYGLEATAPVFSSYPSLPSPFGQIFASARLFTRLPVRDRMSVAGLLLALIDFKRDEATFTRYDRMTAQELFKRVGVSDRLVEDFLKPTLLVGLFKPPEELSAAVTLELLYFYALAHQTSFDVRWIKEKTISEVIIAPLAEALMAKYDLQVLPATRVDGLDMDSSSSSITGVSYASYSHTTGTTSKGRMDGVDAVVLALGAKGLKSVISGSPALAKRSPELTKASSLGAIDCIGTRIWLDKKVKTKAPANVFSRFPSQRGAGGTFFMLDQFQDEAQLWGEAKGGDGAAPAAVSSSPRGSVVACDFYNAGSLLPLSDADIISLLKDELLPSVIPEFKNANIVESYVERFPQAVNWFSPGSYPNRPPLKVPGISNLVCAGDWVKMGEREHGSAGLCQERAYVTGLEAANELARSGALRRTPSGESNGRSRSEKLATVIPIRDDEPQVVIGRRVNKEIKRFLGL